MQIRKAKRAPSVYKQALCKFNLENVLKLNLNYFP